MSHRKTENFIILLVSLACIGLTLESILLKWEFWVLPLIFVGTIMLWIMHISEKLEYGIRKLFYLLFAMFTVFYHGIHQTSLFDIAIVSILAMLAYSFFNQVYMINLFLFEYFTIMVGQIAFILTDINTEYEIFDISRLFLHMAIVVLVYACCLKLIYDRNELLRLNEEKDERIDRCDADMEDFLANVSHELRTPVNVVSGMSDLLIKKNAGTEAYSIKDAGIRLAYQIEDIQDYTECKRDKVILEEEDYMCTSLINDVVAAYRHNDSSDNLELVVDLAPSVPTMMRGDIKKLHKIFRHLLENAVKFTKSGGIYIKMYTEKTSYGVNLCIETTDTGIGMDRKEIESISEGLYQANRKSNRSSGGIGLGLFIVYGFTHRMGGFVKIKSDKKSGTMVRITIPQKVVDETPCLRVSELFDGDILFHVRSDKYNIPKVRDFYRSMAANLATGISAPLYSAETIKDIERLKEKLNVKYIFMGEEEYQDNPEYFDELSKGDIVVAVSAGAGFKKNPQSGVIVMPKPLYAYPAIKILNEGKNVTHIDFFDNLKKPSFRGLRALVVDDEPMNLVVATSIFSDYEMVTETAGSGKDALRKFCDNEYDVIFMDHMMPEMDGVEAMKHIRTIARNENRKDVKIIILTANVVSGAKEMFMNEGFDGFISKPLNISDFERVMLQLLPSYADNVHRADAQREGGAIIS